MDPRLYDVHLLLKPGPLGDKRRVFCSFGPPCSVALNPIHIQAYTNTLYTYIFRVKQLIQPTQKPVLYVNELWMVKRPWRFEKKVLKASTVQVSKEVWKSGLKQELVFTKRVGYTTSTKRTLLLPPARVILLDQWKGALVFLWDHMTVEHVAYSVELSLPKKTQNEKVTKGFSNWKQMHLFKLYWFIAKPEGMSGPLLFKAGSNILVMIFTQQAVFTTSHVASTSVQCVIFQDNSRQLNPPNDEKVEDQRTAIRMKYCLWVPWGKRWRTANDIGPGH